MTRTIDGTLAALVIALTASLLIAFFTNEAFFDWAFERHRNTASWIARPLLLIPFCYFAYKRSLAGIFATILAILTSMFWFSAPAEPRPDVLRFLGMERELLSQGWTVQTAFGAVAVVVYCAALAAAFWLRSWRIGLLVAAAGAVLKSAWSMIFSPEAGHAVLPYAFGGLAVLVLVVFIARLVRR